MSDQGLSVECCEKIYLIDMGHDSVIVDSHFEVAVGTLDAGVVFT